MKRYIVLGIVVAFLSVLIPGGMSLADNPGQAPGIEQVPVVTVEPAQGPQSGNGSPLDHRTELPTAAALKESSYGPDAVFFDIVILRPAGVIACAMGLVASAVALPFSLPTGSQGKVVKTLVTDPFGYTFYRPMGQLQP